MWSKWEDLVLESKNVDASLVVVKKKFTEITLTQIGGFGKEIAEFQDRFKMEGPGAIGRNLDKGECKNLFSQTGNRTPATAVRAPDPNH